MCAPEFLSCPTSYKLHLKWVWAQTHHQPSTNLEPLHTPSKPLAPNIKKSDKMVFQMVTLSPSQSFIISMGHYVRVCRWQILLSRRTLTSANRQHTVATTAESEQQNILNHTNPTTKYPVDECSESELVVGEVSAL